MLDALTLATMRQTVQAFMADLVTIGNVASTKDRYGATAASVFTGTATNGQLRQPTASESRLLEPLRSQGHLGTETLQLDLPYGTVINSTNQVKTADNRIWRVVIVNTIPAYAVLVTATITLETVQTNE